MYLDLHWLKTALTECKYKYRSKSGYNLIRPPLFVLKNIVHSRLWLALFAFVFQIQWSPNNSRSAMEFLWIWK